MANPRHSRQARLVDVGEEGQARIAASELAIAGGGLASEVEARYLAGAGVRRLRVASARIADVARDVDADVAVDVVSEAREAHAALPFAIDDATAREVARGAYEALVKLRRVIASDGGAR